MSSSGVLCTIMTWLVVDFSKSNQKKFLSLQAACLLALMLLYRARDVTFFSKTLSFPQLLC